ncbi:hypothetical protein F0L17_12015 [Streptomyces sp. TRM43335]|uniref:Uncharacterized protein n=1 Tax=Streptomyces taklimakanensis TaxID=2569853 RepID=A0A6G2BC28_9ACTN|nr:hypothetical protein [Streptomyces taklimakanensis]MTE19827.1 hypothetical protein [Streptomyces taklimakanensis]
MPSPLPRRPAPPPLSRRPAPPPPDARSRRDRTRALAVGTAAAALVLAAASGAAAEGGPGADPTDGRGIALSPRYGGEGTAVAVRAVCAAGGRGGIVSSPAFERTVGLAAAGDGAHRERHAVATVRPGLDVGRSYPVIAVCGTGEPLSTSFVHTGVTETVRAEAVEPPSVRAVGGGVALAGLAGGLLVLRRVGRRRKRERLAAWVRRVRDAEAEQDAARRSTRL